MLSLIKDAKVVRVLNGVAAGQTDQTSSAIDMAGFESCLIMAAFGAITAGAATSVKAQQCDTSGGTYADLLGTSITVSASDDNKQALINIVQPRERYLKCVVSRATQDSVIDGVWAILYNGAVSPVTADSTVLGAEEHVSPAEGTA